MITTDALSAPAVASDWSSIDPEASTVAITSTGEVVVDPADSSPVVVGAPAVDAPTVSLTDRAADEPASDYLMVAIVPDGAVIIDIGGSADVTVDGDDEPPVSGAEPPVSDDEPVVWPTAATNEWSVSFPYEGRAIIELGSAYQVVVDEQVTLETSLIVIINRATGAVTRIWGDPNIDWNDDGVVDRQFWGTTTYKLTDGTKITVNTEPSTIDPTETVPSRVTITNGDRAIVVTGLGPHQLGNLRVALTKTGLATDFVTLDGLLLVESASGPGWIDSRSGELVLQGTFDSASRAIHWYRAQTTVDIYDCNRTMMRSHGGSSLQNRDDRIGKLHREHIERRDADRRSSEEMARASFDAVRT